MMLQRCFFFFCLIICCIEMMYVSQLFVNEWELQCRKSAFRGSTRPVVNGQQRAVWVHFETGLWQRLLRWGPAAVCTLVRCVSLERCCWAKQLMLEPSRQQLGCVCVTPLESDLVPNWTLLLLRLRLLLHMFLLQWIHAWPVGRKSNFYVLQNATSSQWHEQCMSDNKNHNIRPSWLEVAVAETVRESPTWWKSNKPRQHIVISRLTTT